MARFIYNATMWSSIAFGILPFGYNGKLQKISPSKYSLAYSVCVNVLQVVVSIPALPTEDFLNINVVKRNKWMDLLTRVITIANIYTLLVIVYINWRHYKSVLNIFNEFADIECQYFAKYGLLAWKCSAYEKYIILKGLATLLRNLSFIYFLSGLAKVVTWNILLVLALALLLGNRRLEYLSEHDVVHTHSRQLANEVYEIIGIYLRLIKISKCFGRIYGKQLLFSFAIIACGNIQALYYLGLLWADQFVGLSLLEIFNVLHGVSVNIFDFWLTITVCEQALGMPKEVTQLLRRFTIVAELDVEFEKSLEILSVVSKTHKLEIRLCGIIELNHLMGLKALLTMTLYLIYLVQFSYNDF
ncbi:putative gustatory receptor 22f [Ceratitis capitata]|uniref:putative gustatory receptor 22f n=1 Tax=Ceratitis capitata TaxID=7213 RepID=UPI00032A35C0|nr:putative gustatory receptor 22f [Ceratitis capitata]